MTLQENEALGKLKFSLVDGDTDNDGDYDVIYTFGDRSFSIWDDTASLVYDSGDDFEQITAEKYPSFFNASNDNLAFEDRSSKKGPEPEAVTVGKINNKTSPSLVLNESVVS